MNNPDSKLAFVRSIAEKHQIQPILDRLIEIEQTPTLKIGFIGEFSSGKTSLINSILGTKLPVAPNPSTKSICLIEQSDEKNESSYYEVLQNGEKKKISFMEFDSIVNGSRAGVAGIIISRREPLPDNCVFVDTPGINIPTGTEAARTFYYLNLLDAAVFCIDVNHGGMTKEEEDFLCSDELCLIRDRIVFALTKSDDKDENAIHVIKQKLVAQINNLNQQERISVSNVEQKIFAISSREPENANKVFFFLKKNVFDNKESAYSDRREQELKECVSDLIGLLETKKEALECDPEGLNSMIKKCEEDLAAIQIKIQEGEGALNEFRFALQNKIKNSLKLHCQNIMNAKEGKELEAINIMKNELLDLLNAEAEKFSGSVSLSSTVVAFLGPELLQRFNKIEMVKDTSVAVVTAAITMGLAAGEAAATTTTKEGAKAVAKAGTKEAAKRAVREAAKTAVKTGAKTAAKTAAKKAGESALAVFCKGVAKIIHDSNPLEHVGDAAAYNTKMQIINDNIGNWASTIALNTCKELDKPYRDKVIKPCIDQKKEKIKTLREMREKRTRNNADFIQTRKIIQADINNLNQLS